MRRPACPVLVRLITRLCFWRSAGFNHVAPIVRPPRGKIMTSTTLRIARTETPRTPRIGVAKLTKMAFAGADLTALWNRLVGDVQRNPADTAALLDLSIIAQLTGDPSAGASLQSRALVQNVLYRSPCAHETPKLRLL